MIVNEHSFVDSMDRIVLMKERTIEGVGTLEQLQVGIWVSRSSEVFNNKHLFSNVTTSILTFGAA